LGLWKSRWEIHREEMQRREVEWRDYCERRDADWHAYCERREAEWRKEGA